MFFDFCQTSVASLINPSIGPSSSSHRAQKNTLLREGFCGQPVEELKVNAADGATLDCMLFGPKNAKKIVVFCPGSDSCHEDVGREGSGDRATMRFFLENLADTQILFVNYRGVHESTGTYTSPDSMEEDIRSTIKYLKASEKFKEHQMVVYGQSLGGLAALNEYGVNIFVDRTFDRISEVVLRAIHCNENSWFGSKVKKALEKYKWNRSLKERTELLYIDRKVTIVNVEGDELMKEGISLQEKVTPLNGVKTFRFSKKEGTMPQHYRPFQGEEISTVVSEINRLFS